MSAFAGIVTFDGATGDKRTEDRIGGAITTPRKGLVSTLRANGALFVQRSEGQAGGAQQPIARGSGRILFAALARLDNRKEIGAALGLASNELARTSDSVLIYRMWEGSGAAGIARCVGAFAFALWDEQARRLILCRDCLGTRALFFYRGGDFVAFATSLNTLLALPGVPRELDDVALANFLALNVGEPRRTFYRGIERVPSRTLVAIDRAHVRHEHYWSPDFGAPAPYRRVEDYVERARELFDQAVAATTADTPQVAIFTSGGFDSSAVAATVARLGRAERITCYTLVPPADLQIDIGPFKYLDERDKVEALARMHPALNMRFITPEKLHPFEEDDTRYFARTSLPMRNPTNLGLFSFLRDNVAAEGHRAFLVGSLGNFGLTWTGAFSLLALLRDGKWGDFAHELHALSQQSGRSLARTIFGEVLMPGAPAALRRRLQRLRGRNPDSIARFSLLNPAILAEYDLVRQWHAQGFDPSFVAAGWNARRVRTYYMFDHNQLARESKAMYEEHHGLEMRDPHADRRLLEFLLMVPESMYRQNGVPRSFARAVLADRLPREILDERRRGLQGPEWFRRLNARRRNFAVEVERLEASPLARRLLDLPRMKRLMDQWPADEHEAQKRMREYGLALARGVHVGRFIRWVEGGNT